ncbi:hypothetical protein GBAR_LOCUS27980 [Geodia barretti]|uniref:Uncharacterized protein n=1 Tax=Geodia barretti TaxID=519541 RepID=A0AA35TMN4_GEOBA|nr:hypothetical protein GBAR_LOCUS27980 [Geodia barretti]
MGEGNAVIFIVGTIIADVVGAILAAIDIGLGAWFLQRDDDIFGCSSESDDIEHDNFIIGVFSILVGALFYYYLILLGIAGLLLLGDGYSAVKIVVGILAAGSTVVGIVNTFIDAVFSGINENCGTTEANAFLFFTIVISLLGGYVAVQVFILLFVVFKKNL